MSAICIIPAKFISSDSRAARIWGVVRSCNHPDNWGSGSGTEFFSIEELSKLLNRSIRTTYRYIKAGLASEFLHSCDVVSPGVLRIRYASLSRIAKRLELKSIGAIAEFPLEEVSEAKTKAIEATIEHRQRASYWQMHKEWGKCAKGAPLAEELLSYNRSAKESGTVIARGKRLIYLAPHWRPFGCSQQSTADSLGISERTVQRHLSDEWRVDQGMSPVIKAQTAHQEFEEMPKKCAELAVRHSDEPNRYVFLGRRCFRVSTNLYITPTALRGQRWQKAKYRQQTRQPISPTNRFEVAAHVGAGALDSLINSSINSSEDQESRTGPKLGKGLPL